jgi:hypothetical protein
MSAIQLSARSDSNDKDRNPRACRARGPIGAGKQARMNFVDGYSDLCYGCMAFWCYLLPTFDGGAAGLEVGTILNVRAISDGPRVVVASCESPRLQGQSRLRTFSDGVRVVRPLAWERRRATKWASASRVTSWPYSRARCRAEGISKPGVARNLGRTAVLTAESAYLRRVRPVGALHNHVRGLHGDLAALAHAGAIVAGPAFTATGSLKVRWTRPAGPPQEAGSTLRNLSTGAYAGPWCYLRSRHVAPWQALR